MKNLLNKITHGDCMDYMKDMPDNYIDLAVVDPPYGINVNKMNMGSRNTVKPDKNKIWDKSIPNSEYFEELKRVSRNQVIWGGNYFIDHLQNTRCFIIWDKGPTLKGRDFAEAEMAWTSFDKVVRIFVKNPNDKLRIHPTQKPVALYRWILQNYVKEGQLILDTHSGSGSLACACHLEKYDFIAIEKDIDYFNDSVKRFEELKSQGVLF